MPGMSIDTSVRERASVSIPSPGKVGVDIGTGSSNYLDLFLVNFLKIFFVAKFAALFFLC